MTTPPPATAVPWHRRNVSPWLAVVAVLAIGAAAGAIYVNLEAKQSMVAEVSGPFMPPHTALISFDLDSCSIPRDQILRGGPAKDGIPSITDPAMIPAREAGWLDAEDLVVGVSRNGEARAYPIRILNWHEAVNDAVGGVPVAVTYCPLCDSALVFDRRANGEVLEFGISGLLYNSNVLLYDRRENPEEESLWSQVMMKAVCGPATGTELTLLPASLTTWEAWSRKHPGTLAMSGETGHDRDYGTNPYAEYFSHDGLMFPVARAAHDGARPNKEQVLVLVEGDEARALLFSRLERGPVTGGVGGRTFTVSGTEAGTVEITAADGGEPPGTAWMFWFVWKAMHPDGLEFGADNEDRPEP